MRLVDDYMSLKGIDAESHTGGHINLTSGLLLSALLAMGLILSGCDTAPSKPSRYQQKQDSAPLSYRDLAKVPDAEPKLEPRSKQGNKSPYRVAGKYYRVMPSSQDYRATGTASWYGAKFHGHLTSNGETYNMFGMSAAHKSLPIPTYLEVTNLNNGRRVIVRVNDRGPFHSDRLIDLSYAAAVKLGFVDQGTAPVKIEAIDPVAWKTRDAIQKTQAITLSPGSDIYLQVGAFSTFDSAIQLKRRLLNHGLENLSREMVVIFLDTKRVPNLHKVQIGPIKDVKIAESIRDQVSTLGLGKPLVVALPKS